MYSITRSSWVNLGQLMTRGFDAKPLPEGMITVCQLDSHQYMYINIYIYIKCEKIIFSMMIFWSDLNVYPNWHHEPRTRRFRSMRMNNMAIATILIKHLGIPPSRHCCGYYPAPCHKIKCLKLILRSGIRRFFSKVARPKWMNIGILTGWRSVWDS